MKTREASVPDEAPALAQATPGIGPEGATTLARHYRRLMWLGTFVFVLFVLLTILSGWKRQADAEVNLAVQRVRESAIHLKAIIKTASDQVTQITRFASDYPRHLPYPGAADLRLAAQQAMASARGGEFNLDALSNVSLEHRLGQILGLTSAALPRPGSGSSAGASNLDLGLSLLDRFKYSQSTSPFLRWSYFFSADKDILVIYPWAASAGIRGAETSIRSYLDQLQTYEIATGGRPENNPGRRGYWTKAYLDQAGAGLMVSRAAPVYWGNQYVGVIASDVLLAFLSDFLREFPDPDGLLLIANEHGQLLADRNGLAASGPEVRQVNDLLPEALRPLSRQDTADLGARMIGDDYVIAVSLDDPRWTLLYLLPRGAVAARVAKNYAPQLVIAVLLVIGLAVVQRALRRMYVAPALGIAEFVAKESWADAGVEQALPVAPPVVPGPWRPWVGALQRAFAERRQYLAELHASNETLERRVTERTQELVAANARLETLAITDPLTGAFNRRRLFELLSTEHQRVLRGADTMSLLMLDIDYFKKINDNYGHAAGDAVLRDLVARCLTTLRTTDAVCRYGGEEFVVLLPLTALDGAANLAERLRAAIGGTPMTFEAVPIAVTVSIGVAEFRPSDSVEETLSRADRNLYAAKKAGRDRVIAEQ
jgi:diguanylate cyclase (GGDEF)-like protein